MPEKYGQTYNLAVTTQGPIYPPSEVVDAYGNFVVIGQIATDEGIYWGCAIVDKNSPLPPYGNIKSYHIIQNLNDLSEESLEKIVLYTLPLPLPMNNYPMIFAPEQRPNTVHDKRSSRPLHEGYIADFREVDGRRKLQPITLKDWMKAKGTLTVTLSKDKRSARFDFTFNHLIPHSVYTVMSLRERDLAPKNPSRPGPLGIPNVFITDDNGNATYWAELPNPFPVKGEERNRVINIVVLFMSCQQSFGGAIGLYGLGGDIHAHLKLPAASFSEFYTME
ncbi:hypothetical protein HZS38_12000 [Xenorhabdus nematophila]|uniref:hypothetical protein n=1 Tax=Xenorhabdus nematophila TaxID=628 RepID=UPI0005419753|nr:hypothetical protein [Xenorhabdus nematophila]CEF31233.1 conserved hypothetical protein [Xenorhabdus nematophila str. Websteri]AYA41086.1 hypothetical protein D3790_12050 [Xenorhabdus nematophila]KHD27288.1 hypothetical protein LH67_19490 [Xenorhabdus nematophila]MBA0019835.1 hypothetical protein [Xenorhabdus nematophila]MCB4426639.1 hypothetical protein [Xenorhabdus nematophila]